MANSLEKLTVEQKAQAYEERLESATIAYKDEDKHLKATLERIFPELKKENGENVREEIITYLSTVEDKELIPYESWIAWLEKQGEQTSPQTNERAWLYLVSDVLTWKDGIGQYLDDPRVQELAKKLCSEYGQKLYKSTVS